MIKESRTHTFFKLDQHSPNAIMIIVFKNGSFMTYRHGDDFYTINGKQKKRKNDIEIHHHLYQEIPKVHDKVYNNSECCRLWLRSDKNKYPVFAVTDFDLIHIFSKGIYNVLKFYGIDANDFIYIDKDEHYELSKKDVNDVIKVSNLFKINENFINELLLNMLMEAKQVGELYHFTKYNKAIEILQTGELRGKFRSMWWYKTFYDHNRVSFTRSLDSETKEKFNTNVCFVLDGDKLSQKYKIKPFQNQQATSWHEMEERVLTDKIEIMKYLKRIIMIDIDKWDYAGFEDLSSYWRIMDLAKRYRFPVKIIDKW